MRGFISGVFLGLVLIFAHGSLCVAADQDGQFGPGLTVDAFYQQTCGEDQACGQAAVSDEVFLASESDRGCCVWKTPTPKCVYTNRAFCERKAAQANTGFEFYKDTGCKTIPACR